MKLIVRTGRWRTCWIIDKASAKVNGTIHVDVHYFEQGNVSSFGFEVPEANRTGPISYQAHLVFPISRGKRITVHRIADCDYDLED